MSAGVGSPGVSCLIYCIYSCNQLLSFILGNVEVCRQKNEERETCPESQGETWEEMKSKTIPFQENALKGYG